MDGDTFMHVAYAGGQMEIVQYEKKILDHGYVKLIETWGSDERVM